MNTKALALVAMVTLSPVSGHGRFPEKWISYDPAVVELKGTLRIIERFRPPDYEENPDTDLRVKVPVIDLARPINVRRYPYSDRNYKSIRGVTLVRLLSASDELNQVIGELVGSEVLVVGSLFPAQSPREYTEAVLILDEIRRADR